MFDSALPDCGVQVGEVLVLHRVVGAHPPLWIAHQQALKRTGHQTWNRVTFCDPATQRPGEATDPETQLTR